MGIFSRIKGGISSRANAAIDKATDPEKEIEMAILELEEGRKKALAELVSYKATAKQLDNDLEKYKAKGAEWERRAMLAVIPRFHEQNLGALDTGYALSAARV